jgi:signal transduction histidine kinase/ligand-binding sensor domain-containing protein
MTTARHRLAAIALGIVLASGPHASALNPALDVSQYAHTAWRNRDGFARGSVNSITQTPDGYLWLGTNAGLLRFDGVRAVAWQPPPGQTLPSNRITSVLAARDGTLWIGTYQGLASWTDGTLTRFEELNGSMVGKLLEDRDGVIWISAALANTRWALCVIRGSRPQCHGEDGGPGADALGLHQDRQGTLWVGTAGQNPGLWRWQPDAPVFYPLAGGANGVGALGEDHDGVLLVARGGGIQRFIDGRAERGYPLPSSKQEMEFSQLLRDRDGGLWFGTSGGLVHVHQGVTDVFGASDGLSNDGVYTVFEDREGNIWVGTAEGLDRFREDPVATYSVKQGLSTAQASSVATATDGSIWIGTFNRVNRWDRGRIHSYPEPSARGGVQSMLQDSRGRMWVSTLLRAGYLQDDRFVANQDVGGGAIRGIVEDSDANLWIANSNRGLLRLSIRTGDIEQTSWMTFEAEGPAVTIAADRAMKGVWVGFRPGGIAHFADGQVRASYDQADGLGEGIRSLHFDRDGALWAATDTGLSRVKDGRVATLTVRNGLPCDGVEWVIDDDDRALWLSTQCGLVRITHNDIESWASSAGRERNATGAINPTVFDTTDGFRGFVGASYFTSPAVKASDGRLWFISPIGVSSVDPRRLPVNTVPPPVHIEQVTADRTAYAAATRPMSLPALTRDLRIDYTALSLVAPEKMRFRYKLEGFDAEWQDAGNRRQAFYTNLPPRNYRFRVLAANNSGVWNETGAAVEFSIAPAYYQRSWFRLSILGTILLVLVALYRLRVMYMARQFSLRTEERVNERTRIARDLHDTLLQSFQGALLKFQAVTYQLADRPDAKHTLEKVIEQATQAIVEGRDAVQGLRSSILERNDLADALSVLGEELTRDHGGASSPAFVVNVEGVSRHLAPLVRDDVYRIAAEALRNAFRHAQAQRIEVEIRFGQRIFRLRVRDDGKGIDPTVLAEKGRVGHYGLAGMQERATLVKGTLTIWSERDSGTETELIVPASTAYAKSSVSSQAHLL